jgi:hypothetical protein
MLKSKAAYPEPIIFMFVYTSSGFPSETKSSKPGQMIAIGTYPKILLDVWVVVVVERQLLLSFQELRELVEASRVALEHSLPKVGHFEVEQRQFCSEEEVLRALEAMGLQYFLLVDSKLARKLKRHCKFPRYRR